MDLTFDTSVPIYMQVSISCLSIASGFGDHYSQHLTTNLIGEDLDAQAESVIRAMKAAGVDRLIFVLALGIYDEVPGKFGGWNNGIIGEDLKPYRRAADAIETSGLTYTTLRPAWLTDEDEIDYELTKKGETFKGTVVSRKSVADLITKVIESPLLHHNANLGINKPNTEGDKPYFM